MESRALKWLEVLLVLALVATVVGVLGYGHSTEASWIGVTDKTFWDYLELLIVPAALAIGAAWLNWPQRRREREADDAQEQRDLEVQNQQAQDEALQAYLDHMAELLLDSDHSLYSSQPGDGIRTMARARTLTVLPRLNEDRTRNVIVFLAESRLIDASGPIVSLLVADLSGANLRQSNLAKADLLHSDLSDANLSEAYVAYADLRTTNMCGNEADLDRVNLSGANLREADLSGAKLRGADLRGADMFDNDLNGPT